MVKRLAIIGAGSSGLVTLKYAIDELKDWEVVCFEKGSSAIGCWGNPYRGFVSTSTKFTTQFQCFLRYDDTLSENDAITKGAFFKNGEYGKYLEDFNEHYGLNDYIRYNMEILSCRRCNGLWSLKYKDRSIGEESFDKVIFCTGLVEAARSVNDQSGFVKDSKVVLDTKGKEVLIMGGGESAADIASRLAEPSLGNKVYLSLRAGIRVSPRYHPVRGVPSDFLRNRLMLSIHYDIRNYIGKKFVEARILHQEWFEKIFPPRKDVKANYRKRELSRQKHWGFLLFKNAKDELFNMFHNKSDGFLEAVGEGRIQIIGEPVDASLRVFKEFCGDKEITVNPDMIIPRIGYSSNLNHILEKGFSIKDFYRGCVSVKEEGLFLIGFARPIIGNIPTISEMQARYVTRILSGATLLPENVKELTHKEHEFQKKRFPRLNTDTLFPVEMFTYCDQIAKSIGAFPSLRKIKSFRKWLNINLAPVSTLQYISEDRVSQDKLSAKIYMPASLILSLLVIRFFDFGYRIYKKIRS